MNRKLMTGLVLAMLVGTTWSPTLSRANDSREDRPALFTQIDELFAVTGESLGHWQLCERNGSGGSDSVGGAPGPLKLHLHQIGFAATPLGELAHGDERNTEQLVFDLYRAETCTTAQIFLYEERIQKGRAKLEAELRLPQHPSERLYRELLLEVLLWADSQIQPDLLSF